MTLIEAISFAFGTDTDLLTATVWSDMLFQGCPDWIHEMARGQHFDLTLLLDCDLEWENDGQRYMPEQKERRQLFDLLRDRLEQLQRPYVLIQDSGRHRLESAIQAIDQKFFGHGSLS